MAVAAAFSGFREYRKTCERPIEPSQPGIRPKRSARAARLHANSLPPTLHRLESTRQPGPIAARSRECSLLCVRTGFPNRQPSNRGRGASRRVLGPGRVQPNRREIDRPGDHGASRIKTRPDEPQAIGRGHWVPSSPTGIEGGASNAEQIGLGRFAGSSSGRSRRHEGTGYRTFADYPIPSSPPNSPNPSSRATAQLAT